MLILLSLLLATPAHAGKKTDPCGAIKPEQQLATERQQEIDSLVRVGITGLGRGQAQVNTNTSTNYDTQLLASDDLARSWYVYQLCVMKRDGVLTASLHEDLMRELFGLEQITSATTSSAAGADAPQTACPWGRHANSVTVSKDRVVVNGTAYSIVNGRDQEVFRGVMNQCKKGEAIVYFDKWLDNRLTVTTMGPISRVGSKNNNPLGMVAATKARKNFIRALQD